MFKLQILSARFVEQKFTELYIKSTYTDAIHLHQTTKYNNLIVKY